MFTKTNKAGLKIIGIGNIFYVLLIFGLIFGSIVGVSASCPFRTYPDNCGGSPCTCDCMDFYTNDIVTTALMGSPN